MAGYAVINTRPRILFQDSSAVPVGVPVVSSFIKLNKTTFLITKKNSVVGNYTLTLDWSIDGSTVVFTANYTSASTPALAESTPLTIGALAPYVRATITAANATLASHQTLIMG